MKISHKAIGRDYSVEYDLSLFTITLDDGTELNLNDFMTKTTRHENEIKKLKECLFQMQNAAILLTKKLKLAIEQRDRMIYNRLTEDERKLHYSNSLCESLDKEIDVLL